MAKGNLFQGMGRGKVGDVVFSRLNGQQIARVRNRNPHNPRTNAQLFQRAIMATVMQAYSAGKEIFDHSFEGLAVGAECQRHFISVNSKLLRGVLADEISNATTPSTCSAKVTAPGIATIIPNEFIVSDGSLNASPFSSNGNLIRVPGHTTGDEFSQQVKDWVVENGLTVGENHTLIFVKTTPDSLLYTAPNAADNAYGKVFKGEFYWVRLTLKAAAVTSATDVSGAKLSDVFDIEASANCDTSFMDEKLYNYQNYQFKSISISDVSGDSSANMGSATAVIRSIENQKLRSRSVLRVSGNSSFGLAYPTIIASWKQGAQALGDSDLILEGGE